MTAYFSNVIKLNTARGRIHVDRAQVSTDGFLYNIFQVCLSLCDPFMDPSFSKIGLIDSNYLIYTKSYDFAEYTKINADDTTCAEQWDEWKVANPVNNANFVTEIFFTTLFYAHYGFMSTHRAWF